MYGFELFIFLFSSYLTIKGLVGWYRRLASAWPPNEHKTTQFVLGLLPVLSFILIIFTLRFLASFDVVNDFFYIIFYVLFGFAWVFYGIKLVFSFFDLSWVDDAVNLRNKAALFSITGAFLGLVLIYCGANIGDGPGWWCVLFAGGLGLIAWFLLGIAINSFTQVFERISVERDIYSGIRFGFYLLASGLILGRASAGDWTSFSSTIVEFFVGWPAIILALLAGLIERYYIRKANSRERVHSNPLFGSILWGILYLFFAVFSIMLYPLVENPMYGFVQSLLQVVL